jgi:putative transposase
MEAFFGHFKDEVDLKECETLEELQEMMDQYIHEYNHHRYQWILNKMNPA